MLKQKVVDLQILLEERLQQQATMFNTIISNKEAAFKKTIESKNKFKKNLLKKVQRKETRIKNLKTLFKVLENKNMLAENDALKLRHEFGDLIVPLLKNEKKNKNRCPKGRRYSEQVKRFAVSMHYHSPKAYEYCRFVFLYFLFCIYNCCILLFTTTIENL